MNTKASMTVGFAVIALLNATIGQSQVGDTAKRGDTTKKIIDTTKKVRDSTRKVTAPTQKAIDSAKSVDGPRGRTANGDASIPSVDGPVRLAADLSDRMLTVVAGDNTIKTFRVAVGTSSKPTPKGSFKIRKIVWNPAWIPPDEPWAKGKTAKGPGEPGNPMKVAKIFFQEPDYYIHGTGETKSLGTADSHGCLRMSPDEVAELAKFLMEHGGNAQEEGWFSRVIHLRWKTHTVVLSKPIPLTISE